MIKPKSLSNDVQVGFRKGDDFLIYIYNIAALWFYLRQKPLEGRGKAWRFLWNKVGT